MRIGEIIKKRRSIRKYQDRNISESLVRKLINAARLAPSAYNGQPSKFLVVRDAKTKQILKDSKIFKHDFVYSAPLIIVCCADPEVYPKERFEPIYSNSSEIGGDIGAVRDLAISSQNLVLMATELGLGTCYVGLVDRRKIKEIFHIPQNYVLPFVITVGYPDENPKPLLRKNLEDFVLKQ
ncbi:MAG: nitroreductase family protein [Candidatus Falkowbacteria bacterium]|nr:nitroreductase family protein [Candidatus Falkowbacteria bacterium]